MPVFCCVLWFAGRLRGGSAPRGSQVLEPAGRGVDAVIGILRQRQSGPPVLPPAAFRLGQGTEPHGAASMGTAPAVSRFQ